MKLHTISLGCQMSEADGAEMAEPFRRRGFGTAAGPEDADAILINTCTVRQHAEDRALSLIGSLKPWKEADPARVLVVAGCAAERLGGWIRRRFPHVDLVVGAKAIESFPAVVEEALAERFDALREAQESFPREAAYLPAGSEAAMGPASERKVSAFVTIMRGCNYSCSYCIVPEVRGRELYRPVETVLAEVRAKVAGGAREVMLLGQTVNSYSADFEGRPVRFPDLLRLVDAVPGLERLRFMSPHPHYLDDAMVSAMTGSRTVCELLHLPVQSGSDRLLKAMRRNYTAARFLEKVEKVRRALPRVVFSTDFIVGFPTESEEDFDATLSLVDSLSPASAYCFKYSPREGTEAAGLPDDVPREVKEERLARLLERVRRWSEDALRSRVGTTVEVLSEDAGFGRTRDGFGVRWKDRRPPGELLPVRVVGTAGRTLLGELER